MSLKFKNVNKFNKDLRKLLKVSKKENIGILVKVSADSFRNLAKRTPRETGRARAGWSSSVDSKPSDGKPQKGKDHYPEPTFDKANEIKYDSEIHHVNNVEYIIPLDKGHSKQAETGIINYVFARMAAQMKMLLKVASKKKVR